MPLVQFLGRSSPPGARPDPYGPGYPTDPHKPPVQESPGEDDRAERFCGCRETRFDERCPMRETGSKRSFQGAAENATSNWT